ncbi:MAG: diguanylate cyclase [Rhodospirillales bacterium]|nr:diguanylate cyclase [Rhodospirillales bacterium]
MTHPDPKSRSQFEAIQGRFSATLGERLGEIEAARDALFAATGDKDISDYVELMTFPVHRLTGAGATFGYPAISRAAGNLENLLNAIHAHKGPLSDEDRDQIAFLTAELRASASQPHREFAEDDSSQPDEISPPAIYGPNRLIYLLEDDVDLAVDLQSQLSHFGYDVKIFAGGDDLKNALKDLLPAALILDVVLPESERAGTNLLRTLSEGSKCTAPAIVISARDELPVRLEAVRAGAAGFFSKPLDIARLVEALDNLTSTEKPEPYRALIIDDEVVLAEFYAQLLSDAGISTRIVNDPLLILNQLSDFRPDVILMDINMPSCNGIELAEVIRHNPAHVQIPILFLTGDISTSRRLMAIRTGGDDFLSKPVQPDILVSSVCSRAERARLFESLISRDGMTGLANHTKIKEQLETELKRAQRQNRPLAFAMIDIDNFKSVNDTRGHTVGDMVIKTLSQVLRQRLRKTDVVGRYGGEEFAVIMTDTDGPKAVKVLDEIRKGFSRIRHLSNDGEFFVTISGGIATWPAVTDAEELTTLADEALYRAKEKGRNRIVLEESGEKMSA